MCFSCDSGGDCECLCTAIAAYAEECNRRGVYIRWRSQELCRMSKSHSHCQLSLEACLFLSNCLFVTTPLAAMQCENGQVYDPCGPACSPSCPSVKQSAHSQCGALSCVEGCFCPAGMMLHGKHFSKLILNDEICCYMKFLNTCALFLVNVWTFYLNWFFNIYESNGQIAMKPSHL